MNADLERRIARVLVGSQHPGLPPGKVDELVTLGVGRATAALIVEEIQTWERDQRPVRRVADTSFCSATHIDLLGRPHGCTLSYGHDGARHLDESTGPLDAYQWFTADDPPSRPPGGAERLGPIRSEPAHPEPATPAEVARLVEVLEAVAPPDHDVGFPTVADAELHARRGAARAAKRARRRRT